jgi:hypothetical protein
MEAILLGGGPIEGEIVNVEPNLCQKGVEYSHPYKEKVLIFEFEKWITKKRARFLFKRYDIVKGNHTIGEQS